MKPKTFNTKLVLNKKTVANLDNGEMEDIYGGVPPSLYTDCQVSCPTNLISYPNCCICGNDGRTDLYC